MKTYQDYLKVKDKPELKMEFARQLINEHRKSDAYKSARIAQDYYERRNTTIVNYQKLLYDISGQSQIDNFSANYKIASGFFRVFVIQQVQYLLSNGATFENEPDKERFGKDFDKQLQKAASTACIQGESFIFYNLDHIEVFKFLEFAPLYDEEDGALKAGVKFWQIDENKPLRGSFYDIDGISSYIWHNSEGKDEILYENKPYITKTKVSIADGEQIYDYENYPTFPIIPLWANEEKQSELIGLRSGIDCYDLIKSGFANDIDDASFIYWTIQNAGGMDDVDLRKFVERLKTVHAAAVDDEQVVQSHTTEVPSASRDSLLDRIRADLYRDAMALDVEQIAAGNVTATQIKAAYEPLNEKCDHFEYCVLDFIEKLCDLAGITDANVRFTRSQISNVTEMVQTIIQASSFTGQEYTTRKLLELFGDGDMADEILEEMDAEQLGQFNPQIEEFPEETVIEDK